MIINYSTTKLVIIIINTTFFLFFFIFKVLTFCELNNRIVILFSIKNSTTIYLFLYANTFFTYKNSVKMDY